MIGGDIMLLGFKVKNFRSFNDLQYFSMLAGKVRNNENHIVETNKHKILKFSGMFGANGSGKSNLIFAMGLVQSIINSGIMSVINNQYFRGNYSGINDNSYFEYEISLGDKLYSYGFEINIYKQRIVSEWLIDMTKQTERVIFERDIIKNTYNSDLKKKNDYFNICLMEMKNNSSELFIKEMTRRLVMSNNRDSYFDDIRDVFKFLMFDTIVIRPTTHKLLDIDYIKKKDKLLKILKALDINISDIITEDYDINSIKSKLTPMDFGKIMNDFDIINNKYNNVTCTLRIDNDLYTLRRGNDKEIIVQSLKFKHNGCDNTFSAYDESDGTIRILELVDILLTDNKLFLIDELDSSLHPILATGLVKLFLKMDTSSQLIVTTHELKTLDFSLIRRDEIWFAEKNKDGETKLYSLERFKDVARFDKKIDKAYLEGRFGAIANIDVDYEN